MLGILRGASASGAAEFAKPFTDGLSPSARPLLLDAKGMTFDGIDNGGAMATGCDLDGGAPGPRPRSLGSRPDSAAAAARDE